MSLAEWYSYIPLAASTDMVLLIARLVLGVVFFYFGWPKVKDLKQNAKDFTEMGFSPGWLWGTMMVGAEFGGAILLLLGVFAWLGALGVVVNMSIGTVWKYVRGVKFTDYSYDLLALALALAVLAFGPGRWTVLAWF